MKTFNLLLFSLYFVSINAYSQHFNGVITYEIIRTYKEKSRPISKTTKTVSISQNHYIRVDKTGSNSLVEIKKNDTVYSILKLNGVKTCLIKQATNSFNEINKTIIRSKDTVEVLNEKCIKYRIEKKVKDGEKIVNLIHEYFIAINLTSKHTINNRTDINEMHNHICLKFVSYYKGNKHVEMASKINNGNVDNSLFTIPKNLVLKYFDPKKRIYSPKPPKNN